MEYLVNTPTHRWGGIAEITLEEILGNASHWRAQLYDRKVLVIKGLRKLSSLEYWDLHTVWGRPWSSSEYTTTTEKWSEIGPGKYLTQYGNQITKQSIGNRHMPWHRDIPWHRAMRYPIRSLYPISMTKGAGATGTRFCDCDVLWNRLSDDNQGLLENTSVRIQNWYQFQYKVPKVDTRWIPLVEKHVLTGRKSVLLNSFGDMQTVDENHKPKYKFSTAPGGTWIQEAKLLGYVSEDKGLLWINHLHETVATADNIYSHVWEQGDLVLFDNSSGVFHGRDKVVAEPDAERLFWRMNLKHTWQ